MWILLAVLSSFFAGVTTVLAKRGIKNADSDVSTAIRTGVILIMALLMTVVSGSLGKITSVGGKNLLFLILSGIATGASWLCYFKALKTGDVSKVVPIDKSSAVLTMLLSFLLFSEPVTAAKICGIVLVSAGIFLMIEPEKRTAEPLPATSGADRSAAETAYAKTHAESTASLSPATNTENESAFSSAPQTAPTAESSPAKKTHGWLWYAVLSAGFATLTSVLGKAGIDGVESSLGTLIRTAVVLVVSWALVFIKGKGGEVKKISGRDLIFILLSGVATGASWLCYFKALKDGVLSAVTAIDKCSVAFSVGLSALLFREKISLRALAGLPILIGGTLCMLF